MVIVEQHMDELFIFICQGIDEAEVFILYILQLFLHKVLQTDFVFFIDFEDALIINRPSEAM